MIARYSWVRGTTGAPTRSTVCSSQRARRASTWCTALQATDCSTWATLAWMWRATRAIRVGLARARSRSGRAAIFMALPAIWAITRLLDGVPLSALSRPVALSRPMVEDSTRSPLRITVITDSTVVLGRYT